MNKKLIKYFTEFLLFNGLNDIDDVLVYECI